MFGKVPLNDTYLAYYATGTNSYTVFDVFRAVAIMFMPPVAFISFVLICVYICLVRPLNKQRRRMFRACTASSAAFIATSYMPHMQQRMGPSLEAVSQSPKVNNTLVPQKAKEDPKVTIVTIKAPKDSKEDEDLDF